MNLALAGLVAGIVHVLSGPDHLAAIAPYAVTDMRGAGGQGSAGDSATAPVSSESGSWRSWPATHCRWRPCAHSELGVGLALVGIGVWGADRPAAQPCGPARHEHRASSRPCRMAVGTLHGIAGSSHLLGIVPALALPSDGAAAAYLVCFCIGSVAAMGAFASFVGWIRDQLRAPPRNARCSGRAPCSRFSSAASGCTRMSRACAGRAPPGLDLGPPHGRAHGQEEGFRFQGYFHRASGWRGPATRRRRSVPRTPGEIPTRQRDRGLPGDHLRLWGETEGRLDGVLRYPRQHLLRDADIEHERLRDYDWRCGKPS